MIGPLEAVRVIQPGEAGQSVLTVVAMDLDTGTLYGIAAEHRAAVEIAELLADGWEMPPILFPDSWQILWLQEAEQPL